MAAFFSLPYQVVSSSPQPSSSLGDFGPDRFCWGAVLPGQLFDEALAARDALVQAAVTAEIALAIQIELVAPMRLANLSALHLEKNVVRVGGPEPTHHLVIPPEDVKNAEPLEYPLPEAVSEMLGLYLGVFRPRLCGSDNPWLFPGEGDHHKTKGTLSGQIIERITNELGIRVTPHQFRHLAAAFILEKDPANYEFVRRVLGHKNLETTIRFYVGLETVDAVRKFSAMALEGVDWKPKP
jgi:integrase